ncbi:hypothetical protein [Methylobacterium oxalidis]|uniref:Uncharacterized protein n=1 Tax=Methylobacterium oxalidis TaxID=944322 RepID=A0A512JAA2_9HYPH|nr:hypothetical protein [Methylobacterium oxalidis]GEP06866.1 hypothetical protein MOX02_49040 [Methylobacterium oxalidis]GJE34998.1 hypothetical protein LDDCCGHA_5215 [Methylobacterium oxalidis]GLS67584.1 hypothetical protein GCM10007888_59680 [Methylobacterium oxalidis]
MTSSRPEPGRTAYEARFAGFPLGPRGISPAWADLGPEARAIWAGVEAAVLSDLRAAARAAVQAHDAADAAVKAEAVDEAIEAEKRMEGAVERLRALIAEGRAG